MSTTRSIPQRLGRTLTLALCAGLLLTPAGWAQQSEKAPAEAKPPKNVEVQPNDPDKGAPTTATSSLSCHNLEVVLQNASSPQVTISKVKCSHGYYVSGTQSVLLFKQSAVHGPDCTITVNKGSATAVLSVQQNYCALEAGDVTAKVISGNATLNGSSSGSYSGGVPGHIWFTIN